MATTWWWLAVREVAVCSSCAQCTLAPYSLELLAALELSTTRLAFNTSAVLLTTVLLCCTRIYGYTINKLNLVLANIVSLPHKNLH